MTPKNPFRVGMGVDSHRFQEKKTSKKLVLGGVEIKDHLALDSHSDGDVVLHALFNALSSAIGEKSIGQFFPDNDPKWKGVDSIVFLRTILDRIKKSDYLIGNVSITLECKTPKISPHSLAMIEKIANILNIHPADVALHATSGEGLTSFGKGEGIYGQAIILLYKK